jgi:Mce-associated membrane protein
MSDSNGPVRRRRIAGEAPPAAPAKKVPAKKAPAKKTSAKKAPATKAPAKKAPATKAAAVAATPVAKKAPAPSRAPAVATPPRRATVTRPVAVPRADQPAQARPPGSRPSRRDLVWLVPATLVALASLVLGVYLVVDPPGSDDDLDASQRQASSAAAGAAETIFSFRYDQLDQHLKASKALMTPSFAKQFDKIAPALTELAPQRKIVVKAAARESAVLPCGDDCSSTQSDVLVFVDQARLVGDGTQPTVFANRIKVSMVKGDDGWRVANIRAL